VQSLITAKFPQSLFCAIETSGDGKVNVQSRVQMSVFKARQKAQVEYQEALDRFGITRERLQEFFAAHPRYASPLRRSPHAGAGTAADRLAEVAPLVGKSPLAVRAIEARRHAEGVVRSARSMFNQALRTTQRLRAQPWPVLERLKAAWRTPVATPAPTVETAVPNHQDTRTATAPLRSAKLAVVPSTAREVPAPAQPAKAPTVAKAPSLPVSEPSADPASALSVARGVGSAAKDFHWLKENIPCQSACPAHTDVPAYMKAISAGRFDEAYEINLRDNVFPAVLGRVCSRPCEAACRHGWEGLGEPVAICWSKRASSDLRKGKPMVLPALAPPRENAWWWWARVRRGSRRRARWRCSATASSCSNNTRVLAA
jgi:hypothetical protein